MSVTLQMNPSDLRQAVLRLRGLEKQFPQKERLRLIKKAARPMVLAAKANTAIAEKEVLYYDTPKLNRRKRAPKGKGKVRLRIAPGTARKSINARAIRKTDSVKVGPRIGRGKNAANYYNFLEFDVLNVDGTVRKGAAPMRKALNATKNQVIENIVKASAEVVERYADKKT